MSIVVFKYIRINASFTYAFQVYHTFCEIKAQKIIAILFRAFEKSRTGDGYVNC